MCDDTNQYCIVFENITDEVAVVLLSTWKMLLEEVTEDRGLEDCDGGVYDKDTHTYLIDQDSSYNPDAAADLIQRFLAARRPGQVVGFEVAYTCSKSRAGHMGGAAYLVTDSNWEAFGTSEWLHQKLKNTTEADIKE